MIGLERAEEDEGVLSMHATCLVTEGTRANEAAREVDLARENAESARVIHGPAALDQLTGLSVPTLVACACALPISRVLLMRFRSVVWHRAARGEAGSTSSRCREAAVCTSSGPQPAWAVVLGRLCAVIACSWRVCAVDEGPLS